MIVRRACEGDSAPATMDPVAADTTGATMGNSHAAVMPANPVSVLYGCRVHCMKGSPMAVKSDVTVCTHHSAHARYTHRSPHAGTQL